MKNIIYIISLGLLFTWNVNAQDAPAPAQKQKIVINGGTAHLGNGKKIENSQIVFENGKITSVSTSDSSSITDDAKVIDAKGKHIYPGFISASTDLGLVEINAVNSTRDARELGALNASIRSIIAYNTDSQVIPTVRSNGVLLAQVAPQGGVISGQSSIVQLDAWNWEDAVFKMDEGLHVNWPRRTSWNWRTRQTSKNENYDNNIRNIKNFFAEARAYQKQSIKQTRNLKFEAVQGLFDKSQKVYFHVNGAKDIMEAVLLAEENGMDCVIVGGQDSYQILDFLKEYKTPLILAAVQRLPSRQDEDIDQPFKYAQELEEAGILYCLTIDGSTGQRNLPFQAGQAVGFGLEYEKAVQAISLNTAKILGVGDRVGSIEVGKDATLFISEGDALDMLGLDVTHAFIEGRSISLDNKQKALYRKYQEKYNSKN